MNRLQLHYIYIRQQLNPIMLIIIMMIVIVVIKNRRMMRVVIVIRITVDSNSSNINDNIKILMI